MNCKPGDLALIFRDSDGFSENIGAIVRVLDADGSDPGEWRCVCDYREITCVDVIAGTVNRAPVGYEFWQMDHDLRPLRPSAGEDEMLRIAGKPQKETA